jgi:hypothetical protein
MQRSRSESNEAQESAHEPDAESLWQLAAPPLLWAGHFLTSYLVCAVWCAKVAGPAGSLAVPRMIVAALTAGSLLALSLLGVRGFKRHALPGGKPPHDQDTPESRYRFLGLATMLLCGLSAIAVTYAGLAAVFIRSCS